MIGGKVRTIALHTFGPLSAAYTSYVALFPTVYALRNFWIHVSSTDSSDIASYIEVSVDDFFPIGPVLSIPNVNPDYCHIQLGQDLDNLRSGCKDDVIKDMILLEDYLDVLR